MGNWKQHEDAYTIIVDEAHDEWRKLVPPIGQDSDLVPVDYAQRVLPKVEGHQRQWLYEAAIYGFHLHQRRGGFGEVAFILMAVGSAGYAVLASRQPKVDVIYPMIVAMLGAVVVGARPIFVSTHIRLKDEWRRVQHAVSQRLE